MRSFFGRLNHRKVDYLLISGQASVLYGAAQFSEDIDLWIRPAAGNLRRLLQALADSEARVYKLTPKPDAAVLQRGHALHFTVPVGVGPALYIDIMGRPPRVGSFAQAVSRCQRMATDWGLVPVVAVEDLVALKRTRRLADYDVISRLVRIRIEETARPAPGALRWALMHSFRAEDLAWILGRPRCPKANRPAVRALRGGDSPQALDRCTDLLAREIAQHQRR